MSVSQRNHDELKDLTFFILGLGESRALGFWGLCVKCLRVGLRQRFSGLFMGRRVLDWALEYHTLILFSKRNPYETKVYTFLSLVT